MFNRVRQVMTCVFIAFLLFVFIVPGAYLERSYEEFTALIDEAAGAEDPAPALERLYALFEERSPVFRMFLDHAAVDAASAAIAAARPVRDADMLDG
ncbi:MAG: hypothetical protein Q4C13_03355, partial [Clostridia bacterium]|nr:hypothetical protein [Clostridia bacterium]